MSQLSDELVEFLVEVCEEDEDTDYTVALLASARSAISGSGAGLSSLISSGVNGKTFTRALQLSALEVARACQKAIKIYEDEETDVASTTPDFRNLQR